VAANQDELLENITHGAEKIINANTDEYVTSLSRRSFISLLIRRHCHQGPHQRRHRCYHSVRRRAHDRAEQRVREAQPRGFEQLQIGRIGAAVGGRGL